MPLTAYPGLLAALGAPYLNVSPLLTPGEMYFVNSVRGSNNNDGRDVLRPMAGWQQAYNKCRANRGDMVVLLPGHAQTITAAAGIALNIAGVTTLALGWGANRPTISMTTATAVSIDVTAANNIVAGVGGPDSGLIVDATGVDAITAAINVQAADFAFVNNRMIVADAGGQAILGLLTTAAANRMLVAGCVFEGSDDTGTTTAIRLVGTDRVMLVENKFYGAYGAGVGAIENLTTDCTNCYVIGNKIDNRTATSTKAMVFRTASTGQISGNHMQILSGTAPITGAAMSWVGANYYAAVIATGGTLI